ncbi:MAG: hypothetical protein ACLP9K_03655 [Nitrososphaerales archaeon]
MQRRSRYSIPPVEVQRDKPSARTPVQEAVKNLRGAGKLVRDIEARSHCEF